ncbi:MAG: hypothetical protein PHU21_02065 [Elusimicrobia bacterium]|nr:hypothetical protein [Elusimicrobiota bacterium]
MSKRTSLAAALLLGAALPAAAAEGWQKPEEVKKIHAGAALLRTQIQEKSAAQVSGAGEGLSCLPFGQRTEKIPGFDPMSGSRRDCLADPYPAVDPAAPSLGQLAAWQSVLAKLSDPRNGGEPVPYQALGRTEYQQGVGFGNVRGMDIRSQTPLDESSHWGDAAILELDSQKRPAGAIFYTLRAYREKIAGGDGFRIKARRWYFHADRDGRMYFLQSQDGEVSEQTGKVMWPPMPRADGPNGVSAVHSLYWRQLLKMWSEALP